MLRFLTLLLVAALLAVGGLSAAAGPALPPTPCLSTGACPTPTPRLTPCLSTGACPTPTPDAPAPLSDGNTSYPILSQDAVAIITYCQGVVTDLEANSNAKLGNLLKVVRQG